MNRRLWWAAILLWAWNAAAADAPPAPAEPAQARPKVALVLSGGGARGFAHLGVLRALRDLNVPVDMVVGTSMGAVVGGAFASGRSVAELERITQTTAWDNLLSDRPAREELSFRRKEDDSVVRSRMEFQVSKDGLSLPPALAGNAGLESTLAHILPEGMRNRPTNRLPLKFRSIASDLLTGDMVQMTDVPLFVALRASLAVPGVFTPVRVDQRLLVDGGLVRNLPVDIARAMGADVIIAVNVGTPLAPESELGSAIGVANQMLQILTEQNVQRSLKELGPNDVLIAPDLRGVSFLDFHRHAQAIAAGVAATDKVADKLRALSVSPQAYAAWDQQRREPAPDAVAVAQANPPSPTTPTTPTGVTPTDASPGLEPAPDAPHARLGEQRDPSQPVQRLRLGLEVQSDFAQTNNFTLKAMHTWPGLGPNGAELRTAVEVGAAQQLGFEYWQPLGLRSPWYVVGNLNFGSGTDDVFQGGLKTARRGYSGNESSISLGRELGNWGDLRLGLQRLTGSLLQLIPQLPASSALRVYSTTRFADFRLDTLDSLDFPTQGNYFEARWQHSDIHGATQTLTTDSTSSDSTFTGMSALKLGSWAGHVYGQLSRARAGTAPVQLGGFLNLSGTAPTSVDGQTVIFGRVVLARQIGVMPGSLGGGPVRLGFSGELGGGFQTGQSIRLGGLKQATAGFMSVDTRLGHLYLGAGTTRGNGSAVYLFFGPTW